MKDREKPVDISHFERKRLSDQDPEEVRKDLIEAGYGDVIQKAPKPRTKLQVTQKASRSQLQIRSRFVKRNG